MSTITPRVAVVTGASSGIGRATARDLVRDGLRVVAVARRRTNLEALAAEVGDDVPDGASLTPLAADLTGAGVATAIVEQVVAEHGRLDAVVHAAGYGANAPSEAMAPEGWDRLFAVNVNAVAHLTAAALPHLLESARERGVADVVTIASTAGLAAEPRAAAYSGSKYAVRGLMEAWRTEYATRDVRFCTVNPGPVATEFGGDQEVIRDWYADARARGAVLEADDVASTVGLALALPRRASLSEITVRPTRQA